MTTEQLLPCPFCGDTPTMHKHYKWDAWNLVHRCKVVGAISWDFTEAKKLHVDRWNSRAPVSAPVQLPDPEAVTSSCDDIAWRVADGSFVCDGRNPLVKLYTEQQVRELLAAHGISEA